MLCFGFYTLSAIIVFIHYLFLYDVAYTKNRGAAGAISRSLGTKFSEEIGASGTCGDRLPAAAALRLASLPV